MLDVILASYGLDFKETSVQPFGDGLINHTWLVKDSSNSYILQKVNHDVFKRPEDIDWNISIIKKYLDQYNPGYLFVSPIKSMNGQSLLHTDNGYYRLFPFVNGSTSVNSLSNVQEAYEAARQFGKLTRMLTDFDVTGLFVTIPDFHNLSLRYDQFTSACQAVSGERFLKAAESINYINAHKDIVDTYRTIVHENVMPLRVIHHDTKINNVLFDESKKGLCVIDLDTVMPGYFISDIGDMMRTYLAQASEEETDLSKITVRPEFFKAIHQGYMEEMEDVLTETEKGYFTYAGKFIIYMQAMRFLTDYLQNDIYYGQKYEGQNLNRAFNQIALLKEYLKVEKQFES